MHKQFFNFFSQNPEYVRTHRNDLYNLFRLACRIFCIGKQLIISHIFFS